MTRSPPAWRVEREAITAGRGSPQLICARVERLPPNDAGVDR